MDDREGLLFLTAAAEDFARGDVPQYIFSAFMLTTLIALQKRGGIASYTSIRRLVAQTLARQFVHGVKYNRVVPQSSSHCPHEPAQIVFGTQSESSQKGSPT